MIKKLKMIKAHKKLSIYELGLDIGTSYATVYKFINGARNIRQKNLVKIYNYINKQLSNV